MGKAARLTFALYRRDSEFKHTVTGLNNRLLLEVRSGHLDRTQHLEFALHMGQWMGERSSWLGDLVAWACVVLFCITSGLSRATEIITSKRVASRTPETFTVDSNTSMLH